MSFTSGSPAQFTRLLLQCGSILLLLMAQALDLQAAGGDMPPGYTPGLFERMLADGQFKGVEEVIFAERGGTGWHWYETFGYVCQNPERSKAPGGGGKLLALNVRTGAVRTILEDPGAAIRDSVVSWDGQRILFSYLKGTANNFLL